LGAEKPIHLKHILENKKVGIYDISFFLIVNENIVNPHFLRKPTDQSESSIWGLKSHSFKTYLRKQNGQKMRLFSPTFCQPSK